MGVVGIFGNPLKCRASKALQDARDAITPRTSLDSLFGSMLPTAGTKLVLTNTSIPRQHNSMLHNVSYGLSFRNPETHNYWSLIHQQRPARGPEDSRPVSRLGEAPADAGQDLRSPSEDANGAASLPTSTLPTLDRVSKDCWCNRSYKKYNCKLCQCCLTTMPQNKRLFS